MSFSVFYIPSYFVVVVLQVAGPNREILIYTLEQVVGALSVGMFKRYLFLGRVFLRRPRTQKPSGSGTRSIGVGAYQCPFLHTHHPYLSPRCSGGDGNLANASASTPIFLPQYFAYIRWSKVLEAFMDFSGTEKMTSWAEENNNPFA